MTDSREVAGELAGEIKNTFTERGSVYGPPEINFGNIAAFWNAWIKARYQSGPTLWNIPTLDAIDVGHMSSLIKKARIANTPDHRDSALDDATYTLLAAGIAVMPAPVMPAPVMPDGASDSVNRLNQSYDASLTKGFHPGVGDIFETGTVMRERVDLPQDSPALGYNLIGLHFTGLHPDDAAMLERLDIQLRQNRNRAEVAGREFAGGVCQCPICKNYACGLGRSA